MAKHLSDTIHVMFLFLDPHYVNTNMGLKSLVTINKINLNMSGCVPQLTNNILKH